MDGETGIYLLVYLFVLKQNSPHKWPKCDKKISKQKDLYSRFNT